jgi:hypothetical protein
MVLSYKKAQGQLCFYLPVKSKRFLLDVVVEWLLFVLRIQEILGSIPGPDAGYYDILHGL